MTQDNALFPCPFCGDIPRPAGMLCGCQTCGATWPIKKNQWNTRANDALMLHDLMAVIDQITMNVHTEPGSVTLAEMDDALGPYQRIKVSDLKALKDLSSNLLSVHTDTRIKPDNTDMRIAAPVAPDGWQPIDSAPLEVNGHLWSPRYPERTDIIGRVVDFGGERIGMAGMATGMKFTRWHRLPAAPDKRAEGGG